MFCQRCGKNPATVHVSDIINHVDAHLCTQCAAETGHHPGEVVGHPGMGGMADMLKLHQQMMMQKMFGPGPSPESSSHLDEMLSNLNPAAVGMLGNAMNNIILGLTAPSAKLGGLICSGCGMALPEFQQSTMYGCAKCYDTFRAIVDPLLMHYHGNSQHVGKAPARGGGEAKKQQDRRQMQKQLDTAIQKENYEEAARLRDLLKEADDGTE